MCICPAKCNCIPACRNALLTESFGTLDRSNLLSPQAFDMASEAPSLNSIRG